MQAIFHYCPFYIMRSCGAVIIMQDKNISSELKTQVHFMCGQSLRESGALKQSINQFNKVISVKPKHVKVSIVMYMGACVHTLTSM